METFGENNELISAARRAFLDFLDHQRWSYSDRIGELVAKQETRLIVNINDLREFDDDLTRKFRDNPAEYMGAFASAVEEAVEAQSPQFVKQCHAEDRRFNVGFVGSFGLHHRTPRTLTARFLYSLVCVDGIVTKVSLSHPQVSRSVHYCPTTKEFMTREYRNTEYSLRGPQLGAVYPTEDDTGNPVETEYGLSTYRDHQTLFIQENPETAPTGQLPRSVQVSVSEDLVDRVKPGDRVQAVGMYTTLARRNQGFASGVFRTQIVANCIRLIGKEQTKLSVTEEDKERIVKLAANHQRDLFHILSESIAPSIHGMIRVKEALLLLLLGGVEKKLKNGHHLRGDINCLLIGDPSVAKSQLLRFVLNIAPLAINTSGRGSSGVGLTAAVTMDSETKERTLEAGAMVLADRGVVCIDEFDKMGENDRVAIHEVMEQQTVTIAKAGIHASLNARCSVVAAANPAYGQYQTDKKPSDNIRLPDSLLSRFDLLFILLDTPLPDNDRKIAQHVLRLHRYRAPGEQETGVVALASDSVVSDEYEPAAQIETPMWEPFDRYLHHGRRQREILSIPFLRKFIHFAKENYSPQLSTEAVDVLSAKYVSLRQRQANQADAADAVPVTARTLETLIRLATAHAKARLSHSVEVQDANAANELISFAMFAEEAPREPTEARSGRKRSRALRSSQAEAGESSSSSDEGEPIDPFSFRDTPEPQKRRRRVGPGGASHSQPTEPSTPQRSAEPASEVLPATPRRMSTFKRILNGLFEAQRARSGVESVVLSIPDVIAAVRGQFKAEVTRSFLQSMHDDGSLFVDDEKESIERIT